MKFIAGLLTTALLLGIIVWGGFNVHAYLFKPPSDAPTGKYTFEVTKGDTIQDVANQMAQDNVVRSSNTLVLWEKIDSISNLQTGTYTLQLNNPSPQEILNKIQTQSRQISKRKTNNQRESVQITFPEGENLKEMMFKISQRGVAEYDELITYAQNPQNFDRDTYEFLPQPLDCDYGNFKKCALYYPEGYLYPDTYKFFVDSTPQEVYAKFLNNFQNKVWSQVKDQVNSRDSFYDTVTLASVLEMETGRPKEGVNPDNQETLTKERRIMADVFQNRTEKKMKWQTDVSAEYGLSYVEEEKLITPRLCQQTLDIDNCVNLDNPQLQNQYNTYYDAGPPIGPLSNPRLANIQAALNPIDNDNLYFVSDATGKKYFAKTNAGHQQNIQKVQQINQKLED
jgi:UPF0755 protein